MDANVFKSIEMGKSEFCLDRPIRLKISVNLVKKR